MGLFKPNSNNFYSKCISGSDFIQFVLESGQCENKGEVRNAHYIGAIIRF